MAEIFTEFERIYLQEKRPYSRMRDLIESVVAERDALQNRVGELEAKLNRLMGLCVVYDRAGQALAAFERFCAEQEQTDPTTAPVNGDGGE